MPIRSCPRALYALIAALAVLTGCATSLPEPELSGGVQMDSLVTTEWLSEHLDDPDLVVLDCSVLVSMDEGGGFKTENGRAAYEAGHIPSAGFADLMGDLCDGDSPHSYALTTPEQFCTAVGALGIGDDSRVVLYDSSNSVWAARVWWMLKWAGFDNAALLDGGMRAWKAEGRPLSTEPADHPAKELTPAPRPELTADRNEVLAAIDDEAVSLIDALPESVYGGQMAMYNGRAGHIPTALNIPALAFFDESGRFRPSDELAAMHDLDRNARFITYCGGGIAASANAFVMTRLGFTDVAVYIASLQEWAADPENPMVADTP